MARRSHYAFSAVVAAGVFAYLLSAEAAPPAPQTFVLKTTMVDVSPPPAHGRPRAPIPVPRHFADPAMLGQAKAALLAATKPSAQGNAKHRRTPTPTSTPSRTPSPISSPVPISSGVTSPVSITTSFSGMNLFGGGGYIPPDTTIAAGATSIVEAVNAFGTVYNLTGVAQTNLNTTACTTASGDSVSVT